MGKASHLQHFLFSKQNIQNIQRRKQPLDEIIQIKSTLLWEYMLLSNVMSSIQKLLGKMVSLSTLAFVEFSG